MSLIAFLLCAAFVGGGVTACVFAYGQGWRAADRMWQSEWDERRPIGRETWVDAGSLGAHPVAATVEGLATASWTDAGWSRARARTPAIDSSALDRAALDSSAFDPAARPRHPRERFGATIGRRASVELDPAPRAARLAIGWEPVSRPRRLDWTRPPLVLLPSAPAGTEHPGEPDHQTALDHQTAREHVIEPDHTIETDYDREPVAPTHSGPIAAARLITDLHAERGETWLRTGCGGEHLTAAGTLAQRLPLIAAEQRWTHEAWHAWTGGRWAPASAR